MPFPLSIDVALSALAAAGVFPSRVKFGLTVMGFARLLGCIESDDVLAPVVNRSD